jgi:hypothetical protein
MVFSPVLAAGVFVLWQKWGVLLVFDSVNGFRGQVVNKK